MHRLLSSFAALALLALAYAALAPGALAQEPELTEEFLSDMANIREGRELFRAQCTYCHGGQAYPGKAPPLRPHRYDPEFVFWVVLGGYGQMPSFDERFTDEEVAKIVAWVKSPYFFH